MFQFPVLLPALLSSVAAARPLPLSEALALAVANHADVQESGLLRDQARARVQAARSGSDPALSASLAADTRESQGFIAGYPSSSSSEGFDGALELQGRTGAGTSWSVSTGLDRDVTTTLAALAGPDAEEQEQATWSTRVDVSVTQDLLAFLRASQLRVDVRTASERLEQAELSLLDSTGQAVLGVAEAWWAWWTAQADAEVASDALEQARALEAQTLAWFDVGEVARLEVDRVAAERLAAERDLLQARAASRATADDLLVLLDLQPGQAIEPEGPERAWIAEAPELDAAIQAVLDGNLQLAQARLQLDSAERALGDARDQRLPSLDLTGAAGLSTLTDTAPESVSSLTSGANNPYASITLGLTVPLGGRAAAAARSEADAEVAIQQLRLRALRLQGIAEARAAVDAIQAATRGVELAVARLDVAQATEDGERARVDEGLRRLDELLDAVRARQAAESERISARVALARAELQLAELEGRILGEVLDVE